MLCAAVCVCYIYLKGGIVWLYIQAASIQDDSIHCLIDWHITERGASILNEVAKTGYTPTANQVIVVSIYDWLRLRCQYTHTLRLLAMLKSMLRFWWPYLRAISPPGNRWTVSDEGLVLRLLSHMALSFTEHKEPLTLIDGNYLCISFPPRTGHWTI